MKVLITAGGTTEPIDNVRVMSNVSTGNTSKEIAMWFLENGHEVLYIHGIGAAKPTRMIPDCIEVGSAKDAEEQIIKYAPDADVIIQAMAVSDFTFENKGDIKLDSSDAEGFIDYLRQTITTNVKILPKLRNANPTAKIIGFKYTVGEDEDSQIKIARNQIAKTDIDATFVNDDVVMKTMGEHVGYLVTEESYSNLIVSKREIGKSIYNFVKED